MNVKTIKLSATSGKLRPRERIGQFLAAYAKRSKSMQVVRGLCVMLAWFAIWVTCLMSIDIGLRIDDVWRWMLTCVCYAGSLGIAWHFGLKSLFGSNGRLQIVNRVDTISPVLRDSLLSSLELRADDGSVRNGSPSFVRKLEHDVAAELSYLHVHELVPWKLHSHAIAITGTMVVVWIFASGMFPHWRVPLRLARVLIPFTDITRPTNIQLKLVEPTAEQLIAPSGQSIRFLVELQGGTHSNAWLETQEVDGTDVQKGGELRRIPMLLESERPQRFSISASVQDRPMRFRIVAGDAATVYRTIRTAIRPKAVQFHATIVPPSYSGLDPTKVSQPTGDFQVLAGSTVRLEIDTNSKLKKGSLLLENELSEDRQSLALEFENTPVNSDVLETTHVAPIVTSRITVNLPILENLRYQLRLTSELEYRGVPIENSFSPLYRVQAIIDQAPRLQWFANESTLWTSPPQPTDRLDIAPNATISLAASMTDEMPIDQVWMEYSINDGLWQMQPFQAEWNWKIVPLSNSKTPEGVSNYESISSWSWEAVESNAQSGDTIGLRLTAVDRKGNKSYSSTVKFLVTQAGLERDRHRDLLARGVWLQSLLAVEEQLKQLRVRIIENPNWTSLDIEAFRKLALRALDSTKESKLEGQKLLASTNQGIEQSDFELVLWSLAKIETNQFARMLLDTDRLNLKSHSSGERSDTIRNLATSVDQAVEGMRVATGSFRRFLGLDFQAALSVELTHLQDYLRESLYRTPLPDFSTLKRVSQVSEWYLVSAAKLSEDMQNKIPDTLQNRLSILYQWIDRTKSELQALVESEETQQTSEQLRNRLERCLHELRNVRWGFGIGENLIASSVESRRELRELLEIVAEEVLSYRDGYHATTVANEWIERRTIHQHRSLSDTMFANDLGDAHRAWAWITDTSSGESNNQTHRDNAEREVLRASFVLEAYHETVEAKILLETLQTKERHEWNELNGQLLHFKEWDGVIGRLDLACHWMQNAGFEPDVVKRFLALKSCEPSSLISNRLNARKSPTNQYEVSSADAMGELLALWAEAERLAAPQVEAARSILARYAPSIEDLANRAATSANSLSSETKDVEGEVGLSSEKIESIGKEQSQLAEHHEQLRDALVELANEQDLLTDQEREIARESDLALKWLDAVYLPMLHVMEQARISDQTKPVDWKPAREKLENVQNAYKSISEHFAYLQKNRVNSGQPNALERKATRETFQRNANDAASEFARSSEAIPLHDSMQSFEHAKELSDWNSADPMALLGQLEQELKSNEEMQQELSEISTKNVQSVVAELRSAADTERTINSNLENADVLLHSDKQRAVNRLHWLAERAERSTLQTLSRVTPIIMRLNQQGEVANVEKLAKRVRTMASDMKQANAQMLRRDIQRAIQQWTNHLNDAESILAKSMDNLISSQGSNPLRNELQRQSSRNEMHQTERQWRDEQLRQFQKLSRDAHEIKDRSSEKAVQIKSDFEFAQQRLVDAIRNMQEKSQSKNSESNLIPLIEKNSQIQIQMKAAENELRGAVDDAKRAVSDHVQFDQKESVNVDRPNPYSALTKELLTFVRDQIADWKDELRSMNSQLLSSESPISTSQFLEAQDPKHRALRQAVEGVAETLRSVSRHESRLGNKQVAETVANSAEQIDHANDVALADVTTELDTGLQRTRSSEIRLAMQEVNEKSQNLAIENRTGGMPRLADLQIRLSNAENELRGLAVQVEESLGLLGDDSKPTAPNKSTPSRDLNTKHGQSSTNDPLSSSEKARMLDELDRELLGESVKQRSSDLKENAANDGTVKSKNVEAMNRNAASDQADRSGTGQPAKRTVREAADRLSQSMRQDRRQQSDLLRERQSGDRKSQNTTQKSQSGRGMPTSQESDFVLPNRDREAMEDWAKLRAQNAENVIEGRREVYDPEYVEAIKAYFRALGTK